MAATLAVAAVVAAAVVVGPDSGRPAPARSHRIAVAPGRGTLGTVGGTGGRSPPAARAHSLPAPSERYAVQNEQQTQGSVTFLEATVIDRRTGDTWTYQHRDEVPRVLPMARPLLAHRGEIATRYPTDPAR